MMLRTFGGKMRLIIDVPALLGKIISVCVASRDNEAYAPSGMVQRLDQFLDLPHLNVLFGNIGRVATHGQSKTGRRRRGDGGEKR